MIRDTALTVLFLTGCVALAAGHPAISVVTGLVIFIEALFSEHPDERQ